MRPLHESAVLVAVGLGALGCSVVSGVDDFRVREAGVGTGATAGEGQGAGGAGGAGGSGGAAGATPIMLQLPIAADERDAWDDSSNAGLTTCRVGDLIWQDACGLQWPLPIPPGATILAASVSVHAFQRWGATQSYPVLIRLEDADQPATFDGTALNIKGRAYRVETVSWQIPDGGLPLGQRSNTPDISNLVQLAVDRPGWATGGFLSIAAWGEVDNTGAAEDLADFGVDPSNAAVLRVQYVP